MGYYQVVLHRDRNVPTTGGNEGRQITDNVKAFILVGAAGPTDAAEHGRLTTGSIFEGYALYSGQPLANHEVRLEIAAHEYTIAATNTQGRFEVPLPATPGNFAMRVQHDTDVCGTLHGQDFTSVCDIHILQVAVLASTQAIAAPVTVAAQPPVFDLTSLFTFDNIVMLIAEGLLLLAAGFCSALVFPQLSKENCVMHCGKVSANASCYRTWFTRLKAVCSMLLIKQGRAFVHESIGGAAIDNDADARTQVPCVKIAACLLAHFSQYYRNVIEKEIGLANITVTDSILCIGSGACPFSAILFHQASGTKVAAIDNNQTCVSSAQRVIDHLGLGGRMHVFHHDGSSAGLSLDQYSVVHFALQVSPMKHVFSWVEKHVSCRTRLLVHRPKRLASNLYDWLPGISEACCPHVVHRKARNIDSTLLYVKGERAHEGTVEQVAEPVMA